MKTYVAWTVLLWFALLAEISRPDVIPSCGLTVPLAVGCIFWLRNGAAVIVVGTALLIRWVLQPSFVPIEIVVVLIGGAGFLSQQKNNRDWSPAALRNGHHRAWIPTAIVTLVALSARSLVEANLLPSAAISLLWPRLVFAAPCTIVIMFAARIAVEFGLQRFPLTRGRG